LKEEEITLQEEIPNKETTNEVLVTLSKGAVESLLLICTHVQTEYGKIIPLTDEEKEKIEQKSFNMSKNGLRVLGLAYKINSKDDDILQMNHIERNLVFLGFAGIMDPPRENVQESIQTCKKAGIKICMITGDHPSTAKSIAIKLGIIPEDAGDGYIITGKEFDQLVLTNKLDTLNPIPQVFARVSPENKYQIVEYLQKQDVVAMIGDGVNDASSIKKSDVGVAMGLSGTDIAKQSASIILTDDNFSSIVAAVKEGRRTLDNIIKFIMYLLSCNFAEIIVTLVAVSANITIPFTSIQILFANLVADVPPSLSLGAEPPSKDIMNRLPRHPKSNIFSIYGWIILLLQSFIMSVISLFGLVSAIYLEDYPIDKARTFTFMLLTVIQLLHAFHSRSFIFSIFQVNPFGNLWLIFGVFFSLACMVGGLYIPVINTLLELVPLGWFDWVKILIGVVLHFIFMEIIKLLLRLKRRFIKNKKKDAKFYSEL
jgi:Ca2+-transporting ATPase